MGIVGLRVSASSLSQYIDRVKGTLAITGVLLCRESNFCSVLIERVEAFNQGFFLLHSVETLHSVGLFTGIRLLSCSIVTGDVYG